MAERPDLAALTPNEWLTTSELGQKLGYAPRTVRRKMRDGTWRRGEHWFKREGSRPLFWWPAMVGWLRAEQAARPPTPYGAAYGPDIPPPRRRNHHSA